jgi:hypothetical protein
MCCAIIKTYSQLSVDTLNRGKTGNRSEILSNIFTGISSSLNQEDGIINLKATPFGIVSIFNKKWKAGSMYIKKKALRNIQFNGSLTPTDSSLFKMEAGSIGVTLSLINKSDKAIANYYNVQYAEIASQLSLAVKQIVSVEPMPNQLFLQRILNASINKFSESQKLEDLYHRIIAQIETQIHGPSVEEFLLSDVKVVKQLIRRISNKPLLTLTPNYKYDFDKKQVSSQTWKLDFQFGFQNDVSKKPVQAELVAKVNREYDTTNKSSNLNHITSLESVGLNFVVSQDKKEKSLFEIKPYFEYQHVYKNKYDKEDIDTYNANVTFRLRLSEDTWLPLTIKYDVKNPKFFGFLSIFWNLK